MTLRRLIFGILCAITATLVGGQVLAGPVTNNGTPGQSPFAKLTIYQRLFRIVDNTGRTLEFGNAGQDIVSSHDLVLRPTIGTTNPTSGVVVHGSGVNANVYVSGRLCLGNTSNCNTDLPAGGSVWQQAQGSYYGGPYVALVTSTGDLGLRVGSSTTRVPTTAVSITGDQSGSDVVAINFASSAGSYAARFVGNVWLGANDGLYDQTSVTGSVYVNGNEVWSRFNQGQGSGLDADLASGNQVTLEPASSCADSDGTPRVACLCFQTSYAYVVSSGVYSSAYQGKHCVDLANRF